MGATLDDVAMHSPIVHAIVQTINNAMRVEGIEADVRDRVVNTVIWGSPLGPTHRVSTIDLERAVRNWSDVPLSPLRPPRAEVSAEHDPEWGARPVEDRPI